MCLISLALIYPSIFFSLSRFSLHLIYLSGTLFGISYVVTRPVTKAAWVSLFVNLGVFSIFYFLIFFFLESALGVIADTYYFRSHSKVEEKIVLPLSFDKTLFFALLLLPSFGTNCLRVGRIDVSSNCSFLTARATGSTGKCTRHSEASESEK